MCKELGRFIDINGIRNIPQDRVVTYERIVLDYQAHKKDPNRVRINTGGNLFKNLYPGELTTRTSDLTTSKCMWNSVISTKGARYMCGYCSNFYLATPLERHQYMRIPIKLIPQEFITYEWGAIGI